MTGTVYITGAGTGRFELLTIRAKDVIQKADIIFYDRLVNPNLLFLASPTCRLVSVGKSPYHPCISQGEIMSQLIQAAHQYKHVVRLKSGDPYIFGRGGEEAMELEQAGISWEYIPGVSSSATGLSFAGVPLTYRDVALDFHVFTAHAKNGTANFDWQAISRLKGTLVFMMGVRLLPHIVSSLVTSGKDPKTPVAMVEWATRGKQRKIVATLETIVDTAQEAHISHPAVIVIGPVVSFHQTLRFFEQKALFGKKIAAPASTMPQLLPLLETQGAEVVLFESPQKCSIPLEVTREQLPETIIFGDIDAVKRWLDWMAKAQLDWRQLAHITFITVQEHTKTYLQRMGIQANHAVTSFEQLIEEFDGQTIQHALVLAGRDTLSDEQKQVFNRYVETSCEQYSHRYNGVELEDVDCLIFPNKKAVRSIQQYEKDQLLWTALQQKPALCLGPNAAELLEQLGFTNIIITPQPTYTSLLSLLKTQAF